MAFNKYYEDELTYLRELGEEFARENPQLAPFLAGHNQDPDVDRLLEGFAFLTGRLRQKLDDELPELTHSLIALLWPHFLRPIPSMSILQLRPMQHAVSEKQSIPRGVEVDSRGVEGTACRFRTCFDVETAPIKLTKVSSQFVSTGSEIRMTFEMLASVSFEKLKLNALRLYVHAEYRIALTLYLFFMRYLERVTIVNGTEGGGEFSLKPTDVKPVGFAEHEGLLPYPENTFMGYRILQEYFSFPEKFLFFDICGIKNVQRFGVIKTFDIVFYFNRQLDEAIRPKPENFRLFCTPVVNLFAKDAIPIRLDHRKVEYRVRASAENPNHYEIYSIDRVLGWIHGTGKRRQYKAFESFDFREKEEKKEKPIYYRTRFYPSIVGRGVDAYLAFVSGDDQTLLPPTESIAVELTCTNGILAGKLRAGDIRVSTSSSPQFVEFENISRVTGSLPPPMGPGLHWRLISNMALNYTSLTNIDALRVVLSTYNFQAFYDRQIARASQQKLEGIAKIKVKPIDLMFNGLPIRGLRTNMELLESKFAGEGDLYLFSTILNEFFSLYANMNSFHQLVVRGQEQGEIYQWPARVGQQPVM